MPSPWALHDAVPEDRPYVFDKAFLDRKHHYLLQSALASVTLIVVLAVHHALSNVAIVSAIAASAFIIFMTPSAITATPRRVIGGHVISAAVGLAFTAALGHFVPGYMDMNLIVEAAAAGSVGVSMLCMAATDTEHPPGAGTVLGMVLGAQPLAAGVWVIVAAVLLSIVRQAIGRHLTNLT